MAGGRGSYWTWGEGDWPQQAGWQRRWAGPRGAVAGLGGHEEPDSGGALMPLCLAGHLQSGKLEVRIIVYTLLCIYTRDIYIYSAVQYE